MKQNKQPNYKAYLGNIKAFAFDVDGVFTDGSVLCTEDGDLLRTYNSKDGFSIRMAVLHKYPVAIITGGNSGSIIKRFEGLGVKDIYLSSLDKIPSLLDFCGKYNLKPEEVIYVGDDLPDIPVLKECGIAVCPSDAVNEVKEVVDYISSYAGGEGCVRDIIEQVMKAHGDWGFDAAAYSG